MTELHQKGFLSTFLLITKSLTWQSGNFTISLPSHLQLFSSSHTLYFLSILVLQLKFNCFEYLFLRMKCLQTKTETSQISKEILFASLYCNLWHFHKWNAGRQLHLGTFTIFLSVQFVLRPLFGLCGPILLQIQWFRLVFRNKAPYALRCVVQRRFEVRWKVPTLAHPAVGHTSESDHVEPIWNVWIAPKRFFVNIFANYKVNTMAI